MAEILYASFIVRLWREPIAERTGQEEPLWMGELESIQTGHAWQSQGLEPLLLLLVGQLTGDPPTFSGTQEQPA